MDEETKKYVGIVVEIKIDKKKGTTLLKVLNKKTKKTKDIIAVGQREDLKGKPIYFDEIAKKHVFDDPKEDAFEIEFKKREKIGAIIGRTHTTYFSFEVDPRMEYSVYELSFVLAKHKNTYALGQISSIVREGNKNIAKVNVLGMMIENGKISMPRIPFNAGDVVREAKEEDLEVFLKMNNHGLYVGNIFNTDIPVYIDPKYLLGGGLFITALKRFGKSYFCRVLTEELLKKGISVVVIDPHNEYSIKRKNTVKEELNKMKRFNVKPEGYSTLMYEFGFDEMIHKNSDAILTTDHLKKNNFYKEYLVREGKLSTINLMGVPIEKQRDIVNLIAGGMFELRKKGEIPAFMLIIEEGSAYAPQKGGKKNGCLETLTYLSKEGGKFGAGTTFIDQRAALLNKDVIAEVNNHIIFKLGYDKDAIRKHASGIKDYMHLLDKLPVGVCYMSGPIVPVPFLVEIRPSCSFHYGYTFDVDRMISEEKETKEIFDLQQEINDLIK